MIASSLFFVALLQSSQLFAYTPSDNLRGTRFEPTETRHQIRVIVDRGHAKLHVERSILNPGDKSDQAILSLGVPEGAVATALKTLGTLQGQPHWFYGELREAEQAAQAYQALTGYGGYYPKDPALLSWHSATNLLLQVFPCLPKQEKRIGYTLDMPLEYAGGRYLLRLPSLGLGGEPATLTVQSAHSGDQLFIDGKPLEPGRTLTTNENLVIALEPHSAAGITGELAVAGTGFGGAFAHMRFMLSKQLSSVPNGAYVVLGIDNSRSMLDERERAVTMAESTLRLFPNAQVQILDFNRRPNPRFVGFTAVSVALAALKRELSQVQVPENGNGSEVDLALVEAEGLLSKVPASKPKRILFFTDALVAERITPRDVAASVGKSGAIVHIITVNGHEPESLARSDDHEWADAARLTGGLVWEPKESGESEPDDDTGTTVSNPYLQLVRPISLDNATFSDSSAPGEGEELGDLHEGSGLARQGVYTGTVRWARLSGQLWSKPFKLSVYPDANAGKLWSALVFGTDQLDELTEAEMMVLAKRGGAVSPVTSYLAIEPGVRPSTEGLTEEETEGTIGHGGGTGSGMGFGSGHGRLGGSARFDPEAFLKEQLRAKWADCNGERGKVSVSIETHFVEVADVKVKLEVAEPEKFHCLEEGAWALDLRGHKFDDRQITWEIQL